jgi:hypothetical protein
MFAPHFRLTAMKLSTARGPNSMSGEAWQVQKALHASPAILAAGLSRFLDGFLKRPKLLGRAVRPSEAGSMTRRRPPVS